METQTIKPTKKVNWKQLATEAGVTLGGIKTKGDKMFLLDNSQEDVDKITTALKTHVPTPKVLTSAETKLQQIQAILKS